MNKLKKVNNDEQVIWVGTEEEFNNLIIYNEERIYFIIQGEEDEQRIKDKWENGSQSSNSYKICYY